MKYSGIHETLSVIFTPLNLKVLLLLYDRPHTRKELYEECSNYNNKIVKVALEAWVNNGMVAGGESRGQPFRLTLRGVSLGEWLLEGSMVL